MAQTAAAGALVTHDWVRAKEGCATTRGIEKAKTWRLPRSQFKGSAQKILTPIGSAHRALLQTTFQVLFCFFARCLVQRLAGSWVRLDPERNPSVTFLISLFVIDNCQWFLGQSSLS
jgi:hypothetical protein